MAKYLEHGEALKLRAGGMSYREIEKRLSVSRSTLSLWLRHMPLSSERVRLLRADSPRRIALFRETMRKKRAARFDLAYREMLKRIRALNRRDLFISGLALYWGEGSKSQNATVQITNTDPDIIRIFLKWIRFFEVSRSRVIIRLHLYKDMDIDNETKYWSKKIGIPVSQFRPPFIKDSLLSNITYKHGFGHGTCNAMIFDAKVWRQVMMGIRLLREGLPGRL